MKNVRLTKKEAIKIFVDVNKDFLKGNKNDIPIKLFNWSTFLHYLYLDGFITVKQFDNWVIPKFIRSRK